MDVQNNSLKKLTDKNNKTKGFYIALTICMAAITAAGWSTYYSIKEFLNYPAESQKSEKVNVISESSSRDSSGRIEKNKKSESTINISEDKKANEINNEQNIKNVLNDNPNFEQNAKSSEKTKIFTPEEIQEELNNETQAVSSNGEPEMLIVYPVSNAIIKEFSNNKPIYSETLKDWRIHNGTDFKCEQGSIVKSVTSGTVKSIYDDSSYGTTMEIEHDLGFTAYYAGLGKTTLVKEGDKVSAGQDIASTKEVPCEISEEPHLHFMINKDGKFIDPLIILDKDS